MFKCQKNKFWMEKPINLFCTMDVVPLDEMSIAEQMNSLTRLVVIVYFILTLVGFKYSLLFLLLSLLFIIILYYIQRNQMQHFQSENYTRTAERAPSGAQSLHGLPMPGVIGAPLTITKTSGRFCNDAIPLDGVGAVINNTEWTSPNQKLVGPVNPRTLIPPVIVPPPADLTYWRTNNLVTHSAINDETNFDVYQSGYQVSSCCPNSNCKKPTSDSPYYRNPPLEQPGQGYREVIQQDVREDYTKEYSGTSSRQDLYHKEQGTLPKERYDRLPFIRENQSGWINTACGYNPKQLEQAGLHTNLASGNCEQDPVMKQYNENLFTQIIQPGVFTRSQINEPINSNIGISFQQQFPPTTRTVDPQTGEILFTEHDPRIMEPIPDEINPATQTKVTTANVYDPRFSGYGTSYRSYTEDVTGQTRFFYDDINAIRMPNYITRSNIDNQPWADQYGPIAAGQSQGNPLTGNIRELANKAFLDSSLQFRTEMQERLMRKNNANAWQRRQAPITTAGQRMGGGNKSCL